MMSGNYTSIQDHNASGSVPPAPDPPGQVSVKFNESSLQTFPPSSSQGKIAGASGPPRDADDTFSRGSGSSEQPSASWLKVFTIAAYQPFFDVDTSDVLERIKDSFLPFRGNFNEKTASNPDLYGPFWICTTLIFVSASIGTFAAYLSRRISHKEDWYYDVHLLTWSASLLYAYAIFVPISLFIILKYLSAPLGLVQLVCLYGYSLFIFIPAVFLSTVPVEIFRWVVAVVAGFISATFVAMNLRTHLVSASDKCFWVVGGIFLLQLGLSLVLEFYLFSSSV